jgi:hypothetical protein
MDWSRDEERMLYDKNDSLDDLGIFLEETEDCAKTIAILKLHQVDILRAQLTRQGYYRIRRRQVSQLI